MRACAGVLFALIWLAGCNVQVSRGPSEALLPSQPGTQAQRDEVVGVALPILATMDRGEFGQAWDASSQAMKDATNRFVFVKAMEISRKRLGQARPRDRGRVAFADQVDVGGPKGAYSIVEVDSEFGEAKVTEKVILVRESSVWKLAGYHMQSKVEFGADESAEPEGAP